jgi:hypothetical protein
MLHHRADGFQRIAFQPIINVGESLAAWSGSFPLSNERPACRPCLRVRFLQLVVGLERLHRFLVFPTGLQKEPRCAQFRIRQTAGNRQLFIHGRHRIPGFCLICSRSNARPKAAAGCG